MRCPPAVGIGEGAFASKSGTTHGPDNSNRTELVQDFSFTPYISALGGAPDFVWRYGNFGGVARWDCEGGKEIRQFHVEGGRIHLRRRPGKAPLYRIEEVLRRPLVLVCEGEKAADAAQELLPRWACTTSMGGASAPLKSDWTPLLGKHVTIWPDNDAPGWRYANRVAFEALRVGALTVGIVDIPVGAPLGFDLADPIPVGWDLGEMLVFADRFMSDAAMTLRGAR